MLSRSLCVSTVRMLLTEKVSTRFGPSSKADLLPSVTMSLRTIVFSALVLVAMLASPVAADPNVVFKGKIMTSTKRYPLSAKSKSAYVAAVRKQSTSNFQENKENGTWKIYFAAFLNKPLNDV